MRDFEIEKPRSSDSSTAKIVEIEFGEWDFKIRKPRLSTHTSSIYRT